VRLFDYHAFLQGTSQEIHCDSVQSLIHTGHLLEIPKLGHHEEYAERTQSGHIGQ
jgi:hypothetical protein